MTVMTENVVWLNDVSMSDVEKVGGKNAIIKDTNKKNDTYL